MTRWPLRVERLWRMPLSVLFAETVNGRGPREIVYLCSARPGEGARIAGIFGFSSFQGGCTAKAKNDFIAQKQHYGQRVVYFGDCLRETDTANKADLAVNVLDVESGAAPANAPILFLNPDLAKCRLLLSLNAARIGGLRSTLPIVAVPNIAATLTAIFLDTSVLATVLVTNLATAASYRRWVRILRSLE